MSQYTVTRTSSQWSADTMSTTDSRSSTQSERTTASDVKLLSTSSQKKDPNAALGDLMSTYGMGSAFGRPVTFPPKTPKASKKTTAQVTPTRASTPPTPTTARSAAPASHAQALGDVMSTYGLGVAVGMPVRFPSPSASAPSKTDSTASKRSGVGRLFRRG